MGAGVPSVKPGKLERNEIEEYVRTRVRDPSIERCEIDWEGCEFLLRFPSDDPDWPGEFPPIGPPRSHESEIWPL